MMRCYFSLEMDDLGRMEARVLGLFERLQAKPLTFSSMRIDGRVVIHGTIEIAIDLERRAEALAQKIEGMRRAQFAPLVNTEIHSFRL